ncbi:hypothetical protein GOBAR_AA19473 [Gossypium barbadense]|uniref:Uncharacterized protein n=1 Tax=Gossypium barbadense TaxID=3634 RepID=A0A2P5XCY2_GOSBA|nr:hypothetical protein GOBAR_AA19473 [Gossypium barbadense]
MPLVCFNCGRFRHTHDTCLYKSEQRESANGNLAKDDNDGRVAEGVKFVGKGDLVWEKLSIVPQIRYKVIKKGISKNKGKGVAIANRPRVNTNTLKATNKQASSSGSSNNPFDDGSRMGPRILDKGLDLIYFQSVG